MRTMQGKVYDHIKQRVELAGQRQDIVDPQLQQRVDELEQRVVEVEVNVRPV